MRSEKKFLFLVFIIGILLRISLLLFQHVKGIYDGWDGFVFGGDEGLYYYQAVRIIKNGLRSFLEEPVNILRGNYYGFNLHTILQIFFLPILGINTLVPRCINVIVGVLTSLGTYIMGKKLFGRTVARTLYIFVMFFPSLVIWSVSNLKEPWIIFFLVLLALFSMHYSNLSLKRYLVFSFVIGAILYFFQDYTIILTLSIIVFTVSVNYKRLLSKVTLSILFFFIAFIFLFHFSQTFRFKTMSVLYDRVALRQQSQCIFDDTGYLPFYSVTVMDDKDIFAYPIYLMPKGRIKTYTVYEKDKFISSLTIRWPILFFVYIKGLIYTIFLPFLWNLYTFNQLISAPQVLFMWLLFPFFLIGIGVSLRYRFKESLPLIINLFIFYSALAFLEGNIGALFRHRDWITPFYLLFGILGVFKVFTPNRIEINTSVKE